MCVARGVNPGMDERGTGPLPRPCGVRRTGGAEGRGEEGRAFVPGADTPGYTYAAPLGLSHVKSMENSHNTW